MTASKLVPIEKKRWSPRVSKIFQINLMFLDVRLVVSVRIDIFLVISFYVIFNSIVTGLNIGEFNQMYEILG